MSATIFIFNKPKVSSSGYFHGYPLDLYLVFTPARTVRGYGFWVHPLGDGLSRFIQPVRVAVA
jgi:hypothetical protein